MTPVILDEVRAVAANPVAAEQLCGKKNVEFHPLACDVVLEAAGARCTHVTATVRAFREEAFKRLAQ